MSDQLYTLSEVSISFQTTLTKIPFTYGLDATAGTTEPLPAPVVGGQLHQTPVGAE